MVVLPVPYESTVSYQAGTKGGRSAILEASRYIELYDQELDAEPAEIGVVTLPELHLTTAGPEAAVRELREAFDRLLEAAGERLVIALGGEHSLTSAPVLAHAERCGAGAAPLRPAARRPQRPAPRVRGLPLLPRLGDAPLRGRGGHRLPRHPRPHPRGARS